MLGTAASCFLSSKDPSVWGLLSVPRWGCDPQRAELLRGGWELLACILEENPFPLGANIHKASALTAYGPKETPEMQQWKPLRCSSWTHFLFLTLNF